MGNLKTPHHQAPLQLHSNHSKASVHALLDTEDNEMSEVILSSTSLQATLLNQDINFEDTIARTEETILMMCAEAEISHPHTPDNIIKVVIFLDSGSTRSYINSELAKTLGLSKIEYDSILESSNESEETYIRRRDIYRGRY